MKLNPQKHKYDVLEITDVKKLRRYAKAYGYDGLPKNIKNVSYYGKRLSKFIDDKQHGPDYYDKAGINAGLNSLDKQFSKKTGIKDKSIIKTTMNQLKGFAQTIKQIRKTLGDINTSELEGTGRFLRKGYDDINKLVKYATVENLKNPENFYEVIERDTSREYIDHVLDNMNNNYQYISEDYITSFKSKFEKLSIPQKILIGKNFIDKFKLVYLSYTEDGMSVDEVKAMMEEMLEEAFNSDKYIKEKYKAN